MRNGLDPRLQLETLAESSLEVLRAAEALEASSDHDADALAEGLALLHAAGTEKKKKRHDVTTQHTAGRKDTREPIKNTKPVTKELRKQIGTLKPIKEPKLIEGPELIEPKNETG